MNTSSKRSAVAAALILSAGVLAGCGGDDAGEAADATATPAWETTPGATPPSADDPADEAPAATEPAAAAQEPQAAPDAEDGEEPAGQPADSGTDGGGDAAGAPAEDGGGDNGDGAGEQPDPDPGGTDDDTPAPVAQPIDGCALGADAIAEVLGANPAPEDVSDPEGFGPGCFWTGASGAELALSVSTFDDWIGAADVPGGGTETVDGLGTEAWASLSAPSNLQLAWRRDDVSVAVSASLASGGPQLVDVARAIDAALLAAGY